MSLVDLLFMLISHFVAVSTIFDAMPLLRVAYVRDRRHERQSELDARPPHSPTNTAALLLVVHAQHIVYTAVWGRKVVEAANNHCLSLRYIALELETCPRRTSKSSVGEFKRKRCIRVIQLESIVSLQHRFRPPNAIEQREGGDIVVSFDENLQTVNVRSAQLSTGPEKDGFTYDRVFPMGTKQHEIFEYGVKG